MNKLILCEGKTDAILLSYYMGRVFGWKPVKAKERKKLLKGLDVQVAESNQNADWYRKNDDFLLICAVGGKDNFENFYRNHIERPILDADAFQQIAIVIDRDENEVEHIEERMFSDFIGALPKLKNRLWKTYRIVNSSEQEKFLELLLLVIPTEHQGALETLLLQSISEDLYDKVIVDACGEFVKKIRPQASKYISTDRLELKAWLSTTWAIQSPEKVFDFIDQILVEVPWEKSKILKECFGKLEHM